MNRFRKNLRPLAPRPGVFRRRMILQLTSLLDLLLIIVFVQYLEMQRVSANEADHRRDVEAQRDRLLSGERHDLYEVWQVHINGNKSVYPDGSALITSATQKKVITPRDAADFLSQLNDVMKYSPRPTGTCILLLTWDNVRRDALETIRSDLGAAANNPELKNAWGGTPVRFEVVEGGFLPESQP